MQNKSCSRAGVPDERYDEVDNIARATTGSFAVLAGTKRLTKLVDRALQNPP